MPTQAATRSDGAGSDGAEGTRGPREPRIGVPADVLFREIAGESVLLDLRSESYFGLDAVGTRMWHALADTGSLEEALARLEGVWDVEPARLRRDLAALVAELVAQGLLERGPA